MLTSISDAATWAELCNGKVMQASARKIERITIDSRENCTNAIFVALQGSHTDGHQYIRQAVTGGASALLVSTPLPHIEADISVISVSDTRLALQQAAAAWKKRVAPHCIAVTGSVGKTTTKEMLYAILSAHSPSYETPENLNTDIGVPLSVLCMPIGTQYLICEFGMRARGEIRLLSDLFQPNMGIITCIGSSHMEVLGSRQAIAEAKMELLSGIFNGTILYDGEEPLLQPLRKNPIRAVPVYRSQVIKLGVHGGCTNFSYGGACYTVPGVGSHLLYDGAIACTTARLLGLHGKEIREGLANYHPSPGRQEIKRLRNGITMIADHYNASPESMEAALHALTELADGATVAILGGMLELGTHSTRYHEAMGRVAAARKIKTLWCIGAEAEAIALGAKNGGMPQSAIHVEPFPFELTALATRIADSLCPGDTLLLKASRRFHLEHLASALSERLAEQE